MANKIQLRRDTADNWDRVNPILDDGEPGLNITTNQIKYGDGNTAWRDLSYASGGGGFTDVDGVVTFPGDLLIGTLWPDQPLPMGDKESVIWAKDDTEYLGMWWGGSQTYPSEGYGPVAGIMIGTGDPDMTDDFTENASPVGTNITFGINDSSGFTNEWRFDRDGTTTFPTGGRIGTSKGGTMLDGGFGFDTSLTTYYANTNYAACVTGFSSTGSLGITTYKDGGGNPSRTWTFDNDGKLTLPSGGAITSPDYNFSFNKDTGNFAIPTLGTDITTDGMSEITTSEVYMGSGYGEFRSIYNNSGTESGLAYAGVEGFNYAQHGDVNFAGMVSQTPNIDSMYALSLNEQGQIVIGFTQGGQTQQSNDWSVAVGTLTTDYTINGLFANTNTTVIGSGLSNWTFNNDGNLTLPPSGDILIDGGTNSAIRDLIQNDVHTGAADYTLVLSDRGKMIYQTGGYSVMVPNVQVAFPVGTVITVVNSGGAGDLSITADDGGADTDIYGAGTDTNSSSWALPSNSIATILKVEASSVYAKWLLSGTGIYAI